MRTFFNSLLGYFVTPAGLVLMGALDSSLVFFLPLGIDFVLIVMSARNPDLAWLYPVLATIGSVAGAGVTYWLGRKLGEHGLSRLVKPSRLRRVEERVGRHGAYSVAALAIIPPPFPFTAFVLTSGAFRVDPWRFFGTLAAVRLARFGAEAGLAVIYGGTLLRWMEAPAFTVAVIALAVLAVVGTIVSAITVVRSTRRAQRPVPTP